MTPPKFYPGQIVVRTDTAAFVVTTVSDAIYTASRDVWTYRLQGWLGDYKESDLTPFSDLKFEEGSKAPSVLDRLQDVASAADRLNENINEFGHITDQVFSDSLDLALSKLKEKGWTGHLNPTQP